MRLHDAHLHFAGRGRLEELKRYLADARVERLAAVSLPDPQRVNFNPEVLFAKLQLGSRCWGFGSLDYSARFCPQRFPGEILDLAAQVACLQKLGFDGLKLFLGKPGFQERVGLRLDDPPVTQALERAAALDLPALVHVADPPVFWTRGPLAGGTGPTYEDLQAQALSVLDEHPALTVIFPHLLMMAHDLPRLAGILSTHPGARLDLAPGLYFYGELARKADEAREFLLRFSDRLLFGTDGLWFEADYEAFPPASLVGNLERASRLVDFLSGTRETDNPFPYSREERPTVRGLGLGGSPAGRRALRGILRENFRALFPGAPAAVDPAEAARYAEEIAERRDRLRGGERPG